MRRKAGRGVQAFVFGMFLLVGIGVSIPLTLIPWKNQIDSAKWERVPCRVLSAEVRSHRGSKGGTTYSVAVSFAYERDGREYRSDRYSFFGGSSSGRSAKEERARGILADPAPGCYVDPADPSRAVFDRSIGVNAILSFMPLIFVLVGAGGLLFTIRGAWAGASAASLRAAPKDAASPLRPRPLMENPPPAPARARDGFFDLTPAQTPLPVAIFLGVFAVIWNGVVGVALHALLTGGFDGATWFAGFFLVPFVIAGVAVFGLALHTILSLFNPRLRLALSAGRLVPGDEFSVRWAVERPGAVARLGVGLELRETVVSWDASDGHAYRTKTRELASFPVVETGQEREIARGERRARIPEDADPVTYGKERRVSWFLKVAGEIPRWPDISLDFELPVEAPDVPPAPEG